MIHSTLTGVTRFSGFTWLFFMLFGAFYIYQILQFAFSMRRLLELYQFYTHLLSVPDVSFSI